MLPFLKLYEITRSKEQEMSMNLDSIHVSDQYYENKAFHDAIASLLNWGKPQNVVNINIF